MGNFGCCLKLHSYQLLQSLILLSKMFTVCNYVTLTLTLVFFLPEGDRGCLPEGDRLSPRGKQRLSPRGRQSLGRQVVYQREAELSPGGTPWEGGEWSWAGHLGRMENDRWAKKVQSGHMEQNEVEGDQQEDGGMILRKQQV